MSYFKESAVEQKKLWYLKSLFKWGHWLALGSKANLLQSYLNTSKIWTSYSFVCWQRYIDFNRTTVFYTNWGSSHKCVAQRHRANPSGGINQHWSINFSDIKPVYSSWKSGPWGLVLLASYTASLDSYVK